MGIRLAAALALAAALPCAASAAERRRIERADQLPVHTYAVPGAVSRVVADDALLARLAAELRRDLEADLAAYEIDDRATLRGYQGTLAGIALLEGRLDDALAHSQRSRELQDKPALKLLTGSITVGAVDRAGDEASFTSYGKVDVYANGFQVDSVVPGGEVMAWSGTSMAAPQVANLAAKILARYPALRPAQVKRAIVEGADEKVVTGRKLRLMNPRRSLELAGELAAAGR